MYVRYGIYLLWMIIHRSVLSVRDSLVTTMRPRTKTIDFPPPRTGRFIYSIRPHLLKFTRFTLP